MTTHTDTTESNKKSNVPANGTNGIPSSSGSALNDLKEAALEDPFFSFLSRWGNVITVLCIIAGLTMLYLQQSEKAMKEAMQESARVLREGRLTFDEYQKLVENRQIIQQKINGTYEAKEGETIPGMDELQKELEKVDTLISEVESTLTGKFNVLSQSRGGYGPMGEAYGVLVQLRSGKLEAAEKLLGELKWSAQTPGSSERMYSELAALSVARALLDVPERRAEGLDQLQQLAKEGTVVAVPAGLAIANIAENDSERAAARELLQGILAKSPEQSEVIEPELEALE